MKKIQKTYINFAIVVLLVGLPKLAFGCIKIPTAKDTIFNIISMVLLAAFFVILVWFLLSLGKVLWLKAKGIGGNKSNWEKLLIILVLLIIPVAFIIINTYQSATTVTNYLTNC